MGVRPSPRSPASAWVRGTEPGALSQREREILVLVACGASNKEAGRQPFISETTVKTHLAHP